MLKEFIDFVNAQPRDTFIDHSYDHTHGGGSWGNCAVGRFAAHYNPSLLWARGTQRYQGIQDVVSGLEKELTLIGREDLYWHLAQCGDRAYRTYGELADDFNSIDNLPDEG